jgi:DNA (cytosine-5)-methyltransferase 1
MLAIPPSVPRFNEAPCGERRRALLAYHDGGSSSTPGRARLVLRVLDLFSGIGGFSLGLQRAGGFETKAFCEIDPFCRRVLARHWPGVPCYDDVRTLTAERLGADGIAVDVICGGFPCTDISSANAGRQAGIDGEQSGLWWEYARLVREIRPAWVVIENSPDLRTRGGDRVLDELEQGAYACWPLVVGAANAGAPHLRRRTWILAHADRDGEPALSVDDEARRLPRAGVYADTDREPLVRAAKPRPQPNPWADESALCRVDDGIPARVGRPQLAALGNAVVPQVVTALGRAILAAETAA